MEEVDEALLGWIEGESGWRDIIVDSFSSFEAEVDSAGDLLEEDRETLSGKTEGVVGRGRVVVGIPGKLGGGEGEVGLGKSIEVDLRWGKGELGGRGRLKEVEGESVRGDTDRLLEGKDGVNSSWLILRLDKKTESSVRAESIDELR